MGGNPVMDKGGVAILLGTIHTKETRISSGRWAFGSYAPLLYLTFFFFQPLHGGGRGGLANYGAIDSGTEEQQALRCE